MGDWCGLLLAFDIILAKNPIAIYHYGICDIFAMYFCFLIMVFISSDFLAIFAHFLRLLVPCILLNFGPLFLFFCTGAGVVLNGFCCFLPLCFTVLVLADCLVLINMNYCIALYV